LREAVMRSTLAPPAGAWKGQERSRANPGPNQYYRLIEEC
jgi:hypothetical protein